MSLELQRTFGLRREEAMKFIPGYTDQGDDIKPKACWTKGGKPRTIPVQTEHQREILDRARAARALPALGIIDPAASKLCTANESLQGRHHPGQTLQHAQASPCLCLGTL